MKLKQGMVVVIGILLSGCTGLSPQRYLANKQSFMLSEGNPSAYVDGYVDGCSVGRRLAGDKHFSYRKNTLRFEKDALYARGWQEGQIHCRNEAIEEDQYIGGKPKNRWGRTKAPTLKQENRKVTKENSDEEAAIRAMWEQIKK